MTPRPFFYSRAAVLLEARLPQPDLLDSQSWKPRLNLPVQLPV